METQIKCLSGKILDLSKNERFIGLASNYINCTDIIISRINSGFYDNFLKKKNNLNVIDCGANIGCFSMYIFDSCRNLLSIEPTPEHIESFKNFFESTYGRKPVLIEKALSNVVGESIFHLDIGNTAANGLYPGAHDSITSTIKVQTTNFKSILKNIDYNIDFVKMNAEGCEGIIIADESFDTEIYNRIDSFLIECHLNQPISREQIANKLQSIGYNIELFNIDGIFAYK
jgi:FkbM family methyltransferase